MPAWRFGARCVLGEPCSFDGLEAGGIPVAANDINLLSATFAAAYLQPTVPPTVPLDELVPSGEVRASLQRSRERVASVEDGPGYLFLKNEDWRATYERLVAVLDWLERVCVSDLPPEHQRTHFFDTYSPEGRASVFTSSRGTSGTRRFFTGDNALRLDAMLNQVRAWKQQRLVSDQLVATLLSVICHGTEKIANTQGTYHDFPRDVWDSRAFKPLTLALPDFDAVVNGPAGCFGIEQDSLDFVSTVGPQSLMYVDPPYNFRQYTSYYFLPNLICRYPNVLDLDDYFSRVRYVRGQNMDHDFSSSFSKAGMFLKAFRDLVERTNVNYVLVSYFTGANHWSKFDTDRSDAGLEHLRQAMTSPPFATDGLSIEEVERVNYASYGGYKARRVTELLLLGRKEVVGVGRSDSTPGRPTDGTLARRDNGGDGRLAHSNDPGVSA